MTPIGTEDLRAAAVAAILYYLPGLPLAHRLARAAGGRAVHWALPCSWALLLGGLFLARLAGLDLHGATWVLAVSVALGLAAGFAFRRRESVRGSALGAPGAPDGEPQRGAGEPDAVRTAEWVLLAAFTLILLAVGGPLNLLFDSLDHLTAIRRSWLSEAILPTDLFYRGGDGEGWDPRKGFLHPLHAFTCTVAGVDPVRLWRVLPAVLAPGAILALTRFFRAWTGPGRRSDAALALWILLGSGSGFLWLTRAGYPNHVAYPLAFFGAGLVVEEAAGASRRGRWAGIALLGFVGTLIHIVAGALLLLSAGLAGLAAFLAREERRERLGRVIRAAAAAALGVAPPLLFRLLTQGSAESELHTHPQGLLFLGRGIVLASPFFVLWHAGAAGLLGLCLLPWALGRLDGARRSLLLVFTLFPWICVWTPLFTPLYRAVGYLVPRFLEIVPVPVVLWLAAEGASARLHRLRQPGLVRVASGLALASLLVVTGRAIVSLPGQVRGAVRDAAGDATPHAFSRALAAIPRAGRGAPPPVVLADPFTSYAVAGMTGAHLVSTLNQHGPPTDLRWRERMDDQRDMLQGTAGARADSLLEAYEVDCVFVNAALPMPIREFGARVDSVTVERALRRFRQDPQRFPVRYEGPEGLVVSVRPRGSSSGRPAAAPEPEESTIAAAAEVPPGRLRSPGPFAFDAIPGLAAIDVEVPAGPVLRGGRIPIALRWVRTGTIPTELPFTARARMQTEAPRRWYYHPAWDKPARLLTQRLDRRVYRQMEGQPLFHGTRNPARLPIGVPEPDTLLLHVPSNAAPGRWEITLALFPETFLPNVRLRDLLRDDDNVSGPVVGSVTVE